MTIKFKVAKNFSPTMVFNSRQLLTGKPIEKTLKKFKFFLILGLHCTRETRYKTFQWLLLYFVVVIIILILTRPFGFKMSALIFICV